MKFVHIEDFFHPDAGYQVNTLAKLQVEQGHEVFVVTAELEKMPDTLVSFFGKDNIKEKDENYEKNTGAIIIRIPVNRYYSGRVIFNKSIFDVVKGLNPDVLFLHCESTYTTISFLLNYKRINLPVIIDSHMLEMASVNKLRNLFRLFYKFFITPIILRNNIPMIRVVDSDYVEKILGIPLKKTFLLSFGTDTNLFSPNIQVRSKIREKFGIGLNDFVVIYAGKLDDAKGGKFLAESIRLKFTLNSNRKVVFIIVGNLPNGEYGHEIKEILSNSENRIIKLETQTYLNLAQYYQVADIAVFPKQCSLSFYDVQSTELPVVLEVNEINNDRVSDKKGILFSRGNSTEFRQAIISFGNMDKVEFNEYKENSRKNVVNNFNYTHVAYRFTDIMIEEHRNYFNKKNIDNFEKT